MHRNVFRRIVWDTGADTIVQSHPIDLRRVALAAAVETIQVRLVAQGWVGLFGAMLDPGSSELRWREDGPGGEAEIRRAYSALMGRFFGRAVLRSEHQIAWLQQCAEGLMVTPSVEVKRKIGAEYLGDLPDWVGWDRTNKRWAICEAKGSHDRGGWRTRYAPCVKNALRQTDRVHLLSAAGPMAHEEWVVACRWGTVMNNRSPTILTIDPPAEGIVLSDQDADLAERELRASWIAGLLGGMGRPDLAEAVSRGEKPIESDVSRLGDDYGYAALVLDGFGLFPLVGNGRMDLSQSLQRFAADRQLKAAVVLVQHDEMASALERADLNKPREAANLASRLYSQSITEDGLTLSWDLGDLDLNP